MSQVGAQSCASFRSSTVHDHGKAAETKVAASRRPIARALHQHQPSDFPPEFYDNLSKIWLTPRALRELDRRNRDRFPKPFAAQKQHVKQVARAVGKPGIDLSRFARSGGPNLCDRRAPDKSHVYEGVLIYFSVGQQADTDD
ncbi:hypothetical protein F4801DRAFT_605673 [Xylaria longipes]|nr:hypothetical protein F4801DRAFT_605673 [Xylaria longipes]